MFRITIGIVFLICFFNTAISQPEIVENPYFKFDHYTEKEGLTSNHILDLIQDREGYLWIATVNGLNRFDGYDFRKFTSRDEDTLSLSSNFISSLAQLPQGPLWIGTRKGLNSLDSNSLSFRNLENTTHPIYNASIIRDVYAGSHHSLWIETSEGELIKYEPTENILTTYKHNKPSMVNTYHYHSILEDPWGNIWVGGRYMGLLYFNPKTETFNKLITDPNDPTKKRDSDVAVYFIDSQEDFWIGGTDGLYLYEPGANSFQKVLPVSTYSLAEDDLGKLWIGTGGGLYVYDKSKNLLEHIIHEENNRFSVINNHINKIYIDNSGNVWIGTQDGLSVYRPSKNKFTHIYHIPGNKSTLTSGHITSVLEDQKGLLWLGTAANGVEVLDRSFKKKYFYSSQQLTPFNLASNKISVLKQDQDGDIWIGQWTGRGMNIVNPSIGLNNKFRFLNDALKADWYSDFLHDKSGNHWIGLWGAQGLYQFNKELNRINEKRYAPYPISQNRAVRNIAFDGRRLWIAYSGQSRFYCLDTKTSRYNYYLKDHYNSYGFNYIEDIRQMNGLTYFITSAGNYKTVFDPYLEIEVFTGKLPLGVSSALSDKIPDQIKTNCTIYSIIQENNNILWVGTNKGLIRLNLSNIPAVINEGFYSRWTSDTIWDLAILPGKKLVVATEKGLTCLDLEQLSYGRFEVDEGGYLSSRLIKFLHEDQQENIWIGTSDGSLNRYLPKTEEIIQYPDSPEDSSSFWGQEASCAVEDNSGQIWIGGKGLNIINSSTGIFRHLTLDNGLASNQIMALQKDETGHIWAATSNGLSKIDARTLNIQNFYEKDGLQGNEFTGGSSVLSDGRLAFAGKNGLNLIEPDQVAYNDQPPEVRITSFKIFEEEQNENPRNGSLLNLKYDQNYFSFEFTALDFSDPLHNLFAYKLDKLDANWIHTDASKRVARYTNVDPGHYTFRVIAANSDGVWNKQGISIPVYIKPPFWKTKLFYGGIFFLIIGIIVLLVKYREQKIKEQNQVLLLEQKLLRSQMNPHFIFNSLSSIQSFIFENNPITAGSYLSQFADLIRSILYNSREEFILLEKEIATLKNYLELQQLRYNHNFDFILEVDPQIDPEEITIPPMLAQPFIENAIEHGIKHIKTKGMIKVQFSLDGQFLTLVMEDNGIGLDAAKKLKNSKASEHQSLATVITRERIAVLNKSSRRNKYAVVIEEIKENKLVKGTRVQFTLPLNKQVFEN